jgi:hypothetical protein
MTVSGRFVPLQRNGQIRPGTAVQDRRRKRRFLDRKAVVQLPRSVRQLIAISGYCRGRQKIHQNWEAQTESSRLRSYDIKDDQVYAVYPHKHHLSAKVRVLVDYLTRSLIGGQ